jgi:hypothetical protein
VRCPGTLHMRRSEPFLLRPSSRFRERRELGSVEPVFAASDDVHIGVADLENIASRKSTGGKLGNPTNCAAAAAKGRVVSIREAERFAEAVLPTIEVIQRAGIPSLRGIASALNDRGVRTARTGRWQVSNVRNVLARCEANV